MSIKRVLVLVFSFCFVAFAVTGARSAVKNAEKVFGDAVENRALAYFIREHDMQAMLRTMFVYADDTFLTVVDDDGYGFAYVEPGRKLLWLNWSRVNRKFDFEAGSTYYFVVSDHFLEVDEQEGRDRIAAVRHYCTTSEKETETANKQARNRRAKAGKRAEAETGEFAGVKATRDRHVAKWPKVDLTPYSILIVEDFPVTDPKAESRKRIDLLRTAPKRVADYVKVDVDPELFVEVRRGTLGAPVEGALVVRAEITQYKPGSEMARTMMAGAGAARFDITVRLIDGATNRELVRFEDERSYAWGGAMGAAGGIETIERNVAHELSVYLRQCKQPTRSTRAAMLDSEN